MTSILSMNDIGTLDRQIAQLQDYKPIPENEVKQLCDKVSPWQSCMQALTDYSSCFSDSAPSLKQAIQVFEATFKFSLNVSLA